MNNRAPGSRRFLSSFFVLRSFYFVLRTSFFSQGYYFQAELLTDTGAIIASGTSTTWTLRGTIDVQALTFSSGIHASHSTSHFHGTDKVGVRWTVSNDPAHTFVKSVSFDLQQGATAGSRVTKATLLSSPLPSWVAAGSYAEGVLTLSSVSSVPATEAGKASTQYAMTIAGKGDAVQPLIVAGTSPLFSLDPYLELLLPNTATLAVKGGDIVKVTWKAHNIGGDVAVVICPKVVSTAVDASCETVKTTTIGAGTVNAVVPLTSALLVHGLEYKIGLKSATLSTLWSMATTIAKVTGTINVVKPISAAVVRGGGDRKTAVSWNGNNLGTVGLKISMCYKNTLPEVWRGVCHVLLDVASDVLTAGGVAKTFDAILPTDSSINVDKSWQFCVQSMFATNSVSEQFGPVVGCSASVNLKPTVDVITPMTENLSFEGGASVEVKFATAMLAGVVDIKLCVPGATDGKCNIVLKKMTLTSDTTGEHSTTIILPAIKDVPAKAGYKLEFVSTTKVVDAVARSVAFTIASKFEVSIVDMVGSYRGGNTIKASLSVTNIQLGCIVSLCHEKVDGSSTTVVCEAAALVPDVALTGGTLKEVDVKFPMTLPLQRDTYTLKLHSKASALTAFTPKFTIIVNALPVVPKVQISPTAVYRTTSGVACQNDAITDTDTEHKTFTKLYTWESKAPQGTYVPVPLENFDATTGILDPLTIPVFHFVFCSVTAHDSLDFGPKTVSAAVEVLPIKLLDVTGSSSGAAPTHVSVEGASIPDTQNFKCIFTGSVTDSNGDVQVVTADGSGTHVSATTMKCKLPVWDYMPQSVTLALADTATQNILSTVLPSLALSAKVPNVPKIIRIVTTTSHQIQFDWNPPKYLDGTVEDSNGYAIRLYDGTTSTLIKNINMPATWFVRAPSIKLTTTIEGLLGSMSYKFDVAMKNSVGQSAFTTMKTAQTAPPTKAAVPDQIAVPLHLITESTCTVMFNLEHNGGAVISGFTIEFTVESTDSNACSRTWTGVCQGGSCPNTEISIPTVDISNRRATVISLKGGVKYIFRVKSVNNVGTSPASEVSSVVQTVLLNTPITVDPKNGVDSADCTKQDSSVACKTIKYASQNRMGSSRQVFKMIRMLSEANFTQAFNSSAVFSNLPAASLQSVDANGAEIQYHERIYFDCNGSPCIKSVLGLLDGEDFAYFPSKVNGIHFHNGGGTFGGLLQIGHKSTLKESILVTNCDFEGSTVTDHGGAVAILNAHDVVMINCTWKNNRAGTNGGALSILSSKVTLENVIFFQNSAKNGGAVSCYTSSPVLRASLVMREILLESNAAEQYGGALFLTDADNEIAGGLIQSNTALFGGGAIQLKDSSLKVQTTTASKNRVGTLQSSSIANGGVVNCVASELIIQSSSLAENEALSASQGVGGAIASLYCIVTLKRSVLTGNKASDFAGAIDLTSHSELKVYFSEFNGNEATKDGGSIRITQPVISLIESSEFSAGSAGRGGCIYASGVFLMTIAGTKFTKCTSTAVGGGGAIYLEDSVKKFKVTGSTFIDCEAKEGPGGGVLWVATPYSQATSPLVVDEMTDTNSYGNQAKYGALFASTAFYLTFQNVLEMKQLPLQTSSEPFTPFPQLKILDYYHSMVVVSEHPVHAVASSEHPLTVYGSPIIPVEFVAAEASFKGLAVLRLPGESTTVIFNATNLLSLDTSLHVNLRSCTSGEFLLGQTCQKCLPGKYSNAENMNACIACETGTAAIAEGQSECTECNPGRFAADSGKQECTECKVGLFINILGALECLDCNGGTFTDVVGSTACTSCGVGSFSPVGSSICSKCQPGFASQASEAEVCLQCKMGYESVFAGESTCSPCARGRHGVISGAGVPVCESCESGLFAENEGTKTCFSCSVGMFSMAKAHNCTSCSSGKYINSRGSSACKDCLSGQVAAFTGMGECSNCQEGQHQNKMGQSTCSDCSPGKFASKSGANLCEFCQSGWFTSANASKACSPAPKGFVSDITKAFLVACAPGKYTSVTASPYCTLVDPGFYASGVANTKSTACGAGSFSGAAGAATCSLCSQGFFGSGTGLTICSFVPRGHYTSAEGAKVAVRCEPGKYSAGTIKDIETKSIITSIECSPCAAGTMSLEASEQCTECEGGKFTKNVGSSSCSNCQAGTFSDVGEISCHDCPAGFFAAQVKAEKCLECDFGQYNGVKGQEKCSRCLAGQFAMNTGAVKCENCFAGTFAGGEGMIECAQCDANEISQAGEKLCTKCPDKSWTKLEPAQDSCTLCEIGEVFPVNASQKCFRCETDTFSLIPGEAITKECHQCPVGGRCTGGASLQARIGWWRNHIDSQKFNSCPHAPACLGAPLSLRNHTLNEYTLYKEDELVGGSGRSGTNSTTGGIGLYVEGCDPKYKGVLCTSCVAGFGKQGKECVKCMDDTAADVAVTLTRMAFLSIFILLYIEKSRRSGASTKSTPFATMIKISLSHMQIISLALSYPMLWPPEVDYMFRIFESIGYLDALLPLGCAMPASNVYIKSAIYMVSPFLIFFAMTVIDILRFAMCGSSTKTSKMEDKKTTAAATPDKFCSMVRFVPVYFLTVGLLYPTLAKSAFKMFTCTKLHYYNVETAKMEVREHLLADPNTPCYDDAHSSAMMLVGMPGLLVHVLGFPLLISILLLRHRRDIMKPRLDLIPTNVLRMVGFAFRAFEPDYYWWSVWRITRKTLMIMTTVFLNQVHIKVKVLSGVFLLALSVAVHIRQMPFRSPRLDFFEESTLICQFITFYLGMFFMKDPSYTAQPVTNGILTALILAANGLILVYLMGCIIIYSWKSTVVQKIVAVCVKKKAAQAQNKKGGLKGLTGLARLKAAGNMVVKKKTMGGLISTMLNVGGKGGIMSRVFGAQPDDDDLPNLVVPQCVVCNKSGSNHSYSACGQCELRLYCSKTCQLFDWNEGKHKAGCTKKGEAPKKQKTVLESLGVDGSSKAATLMNWTTKSGASTKVLPKSTGKNDMDSNNPFILDDEGAWT